jgi:hypothetical protein
MKLTYLFLAVALTTTLAACGGGGSAATAPVAIVPPVDLATKYAGTWIGCAAATDRPGVGVIGTSRIKETLTLVKTGPASFSYSFLQEALPNLPGGFADVACAGTALASITSTGTGSILGKKPVDGLRVNGSAVAGVVEAEKFDVTQSTPAKTNYTDVAYITGNTVQFGVNQVGSDGYPDSLEYIPYLKQ